MARLGSSVRYDAPPRRVPQHIHIQYPRLHFHVDATVGQQRADDVMGYINAAAWFVPQQLVKVGALVHTGELLVCGWKAPVRIVRGAADYQVVAANVRDVEGKACGVGKHVGNVGLVDGSGHGDYPLRGGQAALDSGQACAIAVGIGQGDKRDAHGGGGHRHGVKRGEDVDLALGDKSLRACEVKDITR